MQFHIKKVCVVEEKDKEIKKSIWPDISGV